MKRFLRILLFIFIILLIGRNLSFLPTVPSFDGKKETQSAKEEVQKYIATLPGSYSVFYWNFETNEQFGINEKTILVGASLNKVPTVATLYHMASKGEIDLDETVTIQEVDIQNYGTGSIRYEGPGGVYSLKNLARISFEKSDNTAAFVLGNKIGLDKVQATIEDFGLTQTNMQEGKTSAYDMGILFHKIYKGEVTSPELTEELIGFMDDSLFEDRIPRLLPKDVKVYHKIGDEVGTIHDVGIIEQNGKAYFLAILTDGQKDVETTRKVIADISKMVYDAQKK